jgi:hypothetical protein
MSLILTQTAFDNFTRANENPLSQGGNWTTDGTPLQVFSDLCTATNIGGTNAEFYAGTTLAANQYASATISNMAANGSYLFVYSRLQTFIGNDYQLELLKGSGGSSAYLYSVTGGTPTFIFSSSTITISNGDVWAVAAVGSIIYVVQNGTVVGSVTDTTWSSGSHSALGMQTSSALTDVQLSLFSIGTASNATTYSISGNAGTVAGATVSYSGTAIGSVQTTAGGAYTISGLAAGNYTITPSLAGVSFSPLSQNVTIASSNVTGINFATGAWSPVDSRVNKPNSATFRTVQGAQICDVQTSSNPAVPGVDSRAAGKPQDCRVAPNIPENSRTFPPFAD